MTNRELPTASPEFELTGTVRYFPSDAEGVSHFDAGTFWQLTDHTGPNMHDTSQPWRRYSPNWVHGKSHEAMRGSVVVGAIPGTPAAELKAVSE